MIRADSQVDHARETLAAAIRRGEFRTGVDHLLGASVRGLGRVARIRVTEKGLALALAVALVAGVVGASAPLGRLDALLSGLSVHAALCAMGLACVVVSQSISHRFLDTFSEHILAALERTQDLQEVEDALRGIYNLRRQALFCLICTPVNTVGVFHVVRGDLAFGAAPEVLVTAMVSGLLSCSALYYAYSTFPFLTRLGRLRIRLYGMDPAASDVIVALSATSLEVLYIFSALFVAMSVVSGRLGLIDTTTQLAFYVGSTWAPLLISFGGAQRTFAQLIQAEKGRTLDDLQNQIEALHASERPLQAGTLDHLGKLMDHHNRIQSARSWAVDLGAWLGLANSLALPLIASVVANADTVLAWLRGGPG